MDYANLYAEPIDGWPSDLDQLPPFFRGRLPLQIGVESYIGQTRFGLPEGIGCVIDLSVGEQSFYEGQFSDGYKHGYGRLIGKDFKRGVVIEEGMYRRGKKHGAQIQISCKTPLLALGHSLNLPQDNPINRSQFWRDGFFVFLKNSRTIRNGSHFSLEKRGEVCIVRSGCFKGRMAFIVTKGLTRIKEGLPGDA